MLVKKILFCDIIYIVQERKVIKEWLKIQKATKTKDPII